MCQSLFNCDNGIRNCSFCKIYIKQAPGCLIELIPTYNEAYQTKHIADVP